MLSVHLVLEICGLKVVVSFNFAPSAPHVKRRVKSCEPRAAAATNGLSHAHWQAKSSAQTQPPTGMRRIKPLHLFWKRMALFNMFMKNIHVSLCSINLCLENGPGKKCIWKCICQIHQIRGIKYKYMVWNLIKYRYAVFVFVFANTNKYSTPALAFNTHFLKQLQQKLGGGGGGYIFDSFSPCSLLPSIEVNY